MTAAPTGGGASGCPGVPDYGNYGVYVQRLFASKNDENVVYALSENSKNGDFKPYVYKSANRGASWESISGDLPANGPALSFAEDHVNPNLLFVGTEFGLFFTVDGGKKWVRLRGNLPTIAVRDLAIQERENDLVLGDVRPRLLRARRLHAAAAVVAGDVRSRRPRLPHQDRGDRGARKPAGRAARRASNCGWRENRPLGAILTYWIKEAPSSQRQRRTLDARAARSKKRRRGIRRRRSSPRKRMKKQPQTFLTITDGDRQGGAPTDRARRTRHPSLRLEPARRGADDRRRRFRRRRRRRRR